MYSKDKVNEVVKQARAGKPAMEIASNVGVHYMTVLKWLKIRGVKAKRGPGGLGLKYPVAFYADIAERIKTKTLQRVADEFGVTRERVRQWAKIAGFKKSEFIK
jgi:predicted transcriptional regulator